MAKQRLASLDVVRGLAALAVVVQHWWQHFGTLPGASDIPGGVDLPFYNLLWPFFLNGSRAVTLFFNLSGFVFFWLYSDEIANRRIGFIRFMGLRFSRLYPLHLATLIVVIPLQFVFIQYIGSPFICKFNDFYHFVLNLLLVQYWGFEKGYSFNGPSWSISVEIALYLIFFAVCFIRLQRFWSLLVLLLVSWSIARFSIIPSAAIAFFAGGLAFYIFTYFENKSNRYWDYIILTIAVLLWIVAPYVAGGTSLADKFENFLSGFSMEPPAFVMVALRLFGQRLWELLVFPGTIVALALAERRYRLSFKWFEWLGNISYSTYLLHFPLQMIFALIAIYLGNGPEVFLRKDVFIGFFLVLIALSLASYNYFELPAQAFLRNWFPKKSLKTKLMDQIESSDG